MSLLKQILEIATNVVEKSGGTAAGLGRVPSTGLGVVALQSIDPHWAEKVMKDPSRVKSNKTFNGLLQSTYSYDPARKERYEEYARENKVDRFKMTKMPELQATLYSGHISSENKDYHPKILLNNDGTVRIVCDCPDYQFTWVYSNLRGHVALGHEIPTTISEAETRHSEGAVGICKHLYLLGNRIGIA